MLPSPYLKTLLFGLLSLGAVRCDAQVAQCASLRLLNVELDGRVDDFTRNHGRFKRIKSAVLDTRKDLYVYTPPGYCSQRKYPLVLWLHGAFGDEHSFFEGAQLRFVDHEILCGRLPPMIIACPDGTYSGRNFLLSKHSFYANGQQGCYRDFLVKEVLPFVEDRYAIDPCRRKHAIIGVSAGAVGGMSLALRRHDYFGAVASVGGALNLRYYNTQHDYARDFEPTAFRMRTQWNPQETIGKIGPLKLRAGTFIKPVFGNDQQTMQRVIAENPADVLCRCELRPGKLNMLVAYACRDEFNFDAQAESFVWLAHQRDLKVDVMRDADGQHNGDFFVPMQRRVLRWLAPQFGADCEASTTQTSAKSES